MSRYIDADKLKEELKYSGYCNNNWLDIEMYINNQPTADVRENVRGEWIDKSGGIEGAWNYCSVCGEQAIDLYNFCPNCGADMRGDQT